MSIRILHGDCLEVLPTLEAASVDSIVTDPPYGLNFMGKAWDRGVPGVPFWTAMLRVLKPGGHLVAFGGSRTFHRMTCAIEDAGFEIRDSLYWLYGSGFPKSLDVSKAIDKAAGATREVVGFDASKYRPNRDKHLLAGQPGGGGKLRADNGATETAPATPEAAAWQGWGTALKPACEPIVLARKPLIGSVAANVLKHGVGGINIDACRVEGRERTDYGLATATRTHGAVYGEPSAAADFDSSKGRWPANVCHDGSDEVLAAFAAYGESKSVGGYRGAGKRDRGWHMKADEDRQPLGFGDTGTAARFYYCAKAGAADRAGSKHPTVKPLALMDWLVKLITPPGGTVLDPFAGSGTTLLAADRLQMQAIGIEREAEYVADIKQRLMVDAPLFAEVS